MNKGKWYLVYTRTNEMEAGTFRGGIEDVEVALKANSETEAIAEAQTEWNQIVKERDEYWEKCKKTWAHPPTSPTEWGARNPRVIHKISLQ